MKRIAATFTLLERVVVMAIIAVTTSLAVAPFRGNSPARQIADAAVSFEAYFARIQYRATEEGRDYLVAFEPEKRRFAAAPVEYSAPAAVEGLEVLEELQNNSGTAHWEGTVPAALAWELPQNFTLDSEALDAGDNSGAERIELFRFYPDGTASGRREFILRCRTLECRFEVSRLTGRLLRKTGEEP